MIQSLVFLTISKWLLIRSFYVSYSCENSFPSRKGVFLLLGKNEKGEVCMEFTFDLEKNKEQILEFKEFILEHKEMPGALIPVLQEAQVKFGYLPREIMALIAKGLEVPASKVFGVATYYSQFTFIPKGKHNISICLGTACYVKGAQDILEEFQNILGIKGGETTPDLQFSITDCRCVGDCSKAPVVVIDEDVYAKVKKSDVKDLIAKYSKEVENID